MKHLFAIACAVAWLLACKPHEVKEPTVFTKNVKTTTSAAPPVDLSKKKINETIPIEPVLVDDKGIGPKLGADGTVTGETKTFKTTDAIHVTMKFHESPVGLQASVVVHGAGGTTHFRDQKPMNGGKVVTFTIPPKTLKPGQYRLEGYWGGNVAVDYDIDVRSH